MLGTPWGEYSRVASATAVCTPPADELAWLTCPDSLLGVSESELGPRFSVPFLLQDILLFVRFFMRWTTAADGTTLIPFKVTVGGCVW